MADASPTCVIRPMRAEDVPAAERLSDEGFFELDARSRRARGPSPAAAPPDARPRLDRAHQHLLRTDPGGCWVAEDDGRAGRHRDVVQPREAVVPGDVRRAARACRARASASRCSARGAAPRPRLPARRCSRPPPTTRGRCAATAWPASPAPADVPDRHRRPGRDPGGGEGARGRRRRRRPDGLHRPADPRRRARAGPRADAARRWRLLVSDTTPGPATPTSTSGGQVALLAATNRRTATRLLWAALADGPRARRRVAHVTAANEWALDVGLAARLDAAPGGLPGAARHEAARAVPAQRRAAVSRDRVD